MHIHTPVKRHREAYTVKRQRGEPGHTRDTHTRDTRAHKGTRITPTNLTTIQTHQHTPARQRNGRNRGRLNSRRPGADRSPRPTQKRPPPANPTLPPPAPRAPPRACSKAVGEMKAHIPVTPPRSTRREMLHRTHFHNTPNANGQHLAARTCSLSDT